MARRGSGSWYGLKVLRLRWPRRGGPASEQARPVGGNRERGQSLVELALAMLILPTLLAGVINFGMAFLNWIALRDAAQEGAAYGSVAPTDCSGIVSRARDNLSGTQVSGATPTVFVYDKACTSAGPGDACSPTSDRPPHTVEVRIDAPFPLWIPFLNALPAPVLHASASDTILTPSCPYP